MSPALKIALHACCAPCAARALAALGQTHPDAAIKVIWLNPNIHPLIEYRRRLKALRIFLGRENVALQIAGEYGLKAFLSELDGKYDQPERCAVCYAQRLGLAAKIAAQGGADTFASTLAASPHQPRELLQTALETAAAAAGLTPLWGNWADTPLAADALGGIYRQSYCGCVFSEEERYANTNKHLYRPD